MAPAQPYIIAALSCGVEGTIHISGPSVMSNQCCGGQNYPVVGYTWGNGGYLTGAVGSILMPTISYNITCASLACQCGGIDPVGFPVCGGVWVCMDNAVVGFHPIATAVSSLVFSAYANGANGAWSIDA